MAVIKIVPMPGAVGDKGDEGAPGPQGPQGETGLQGPAGADALWNYNGEWQSNSSYATGDVITYQGQLYYAKTITTAGTLPTDTSKFDLIAAKGADGEPGLNGLEGETGPQGPAGEDGSTPFILIGPYDNGASYTLGDAVYYNGGTYVRTGNPLNPGYPPTPGSVNESWTPVADRGEQGEQGSEGAQGPQGEPGLDAEVVEEVSFTVNGGTLGTQPTFDGSPLFSGSYVKTGPMVHFQIQVDMDNITNFGTGQYFIDLPFPAKYGYQVKQGCLHDDSSDKQYAIGGHVFAGQSQLALTFTNSAGQDEAFDFNSPVTLNVADNFHIAGTYITS